MNWVTISRSSPVTCKYPLCCVDGPTMRQSHPRVCLGSSSCSRPTEQVSDIAVTMATTARGPVRVGKQLAGVHNSFGGAFFFAIRQQASGIRHQTSDIRHHQADRWTDALLLLAYPLLSSLFLFFFVCHTQSLLPPCPPPPLLLRRIRSQLQS
ncbi:hypothetical protein DFP73DRAFT_163338 [Morchella snyderi]|nr:hypothetical protein DFP73DRAFT_163338 [Morchella snyderi]